MILSVSPRIWGLVLLYLLVCSFCSSADSLSAASTGPLVQQILCKQLICTWHHDSHWRCKQKRQKFLPTWRFQSSGENRCLNERESPWLHCSLWTSQAGSTKVTRSPSAFISESRRPSTPECLQGFSLRLLFPFFSFSKQLSPSFIPC